MDLMAFSLLIVGLVAGFFIGFLAKKRSIDSTTPDENNKLITENGELKGRLNNATEVFKDHNRKMEELTNQKEELISEVAHLKTFNDNIQTRLKEQKSELENLQEKFTTDFSLIANKLLKQNSSEFAESNQKKMDEILAPLKENIKAIGIS